MREQIINKIISDANYKKICKVLNTSYSDDIYQEVCLQILEMPEERLPRLDGLNFWFYCIVRNMSSKTGTFGKLVLKNEIELANQKGKIIESSSITESDLRKAELFMLELSEFENRIVILYNELGDMSKVQRATGISYSALRKVKNKLKSFK